LAAWETFGLQELSKLLQSVRHRALLRASTSPSASTEDPPQGTLYAPR